MSKDPPRSRRRHLTSEDEALWEHTASSLEPIRGKKQRHHPHVPEDPAAVPPFQTRAKKATGKAPPAIAVTVTPPQTAPRPTPDLNTFDRKAARKLRQGQFSIEARIDLHGMRQNEAHVALRRFLITSFSRGLRWVLVITGKGAPRVKDDEPWGFGVPERGVLKRNVPMWLAEPELRAVVVSYTTASISHGGEGALYVQLRNPDRAR